MTIGMNNLGKNGRLGNQMFQYAALVGIAKQSGYDFVIPSDCDLVRGFGMLHCGKRFGMIDGPSLTASCTINALQPKSVLIIHLGAFKLCHSGSFCPFTAA